MRHLREQLTRYVVQWVNRMESLNIYPSPNMEEGHHCREAP